MWDSGADVHDIRYLETLLEVALSGGSEQLPYRRLPLTPRFTSSVDRALILGHRHEGLNLVWMCKQPDIAPLRLMQEVVECEVPEAVASSELRSFQRRNLDPVRVFHQALPALRATGALVGVLAWTRPNGELGWGKVMSYVQGLPSTVVLSKMKDLAEAQMGISSN